MGLRCSNHNQRRMIREEARGTCLNPAVQRVTNRRSVPPRVLELRSRSGSFVPAFSAKRGPLLSHWGQGVPPE